MILMKCDDPNCGMKKFEQQAKARRWACRKTTYVEGMGLFICSQEHEDHPRDGAIYFHRDDTYGTFEWTTVEETR